MSLLSEFVRVTSRRRCPICDHGDWCLVSIDGGDSPVSAICPRIESPYRIGSAGFLHRLREGHAEPTRRSQTLPELPQDRGDDAERFAQSADLDAIAAALGLPAHSLGRLRVGWFGAQRCSTWPLRDYSGRCVGIVRRYSDGAKRLFRDHRSGLYFSVDLPARLDGERLLICEGATDTAAALALGRCAVGRFSCGTGNRDLARLVRHRKPSGLTIVADADDPGRKGASELARYLAPFCAEIAIIEPPTEFKDLRAWYVAGCSADDLRRREEAAR